MITPTNLCYGCMNEKVIEGKCPICGYNPDEPTNPLFLKPGFVLNSRYLIGKVTDSNGEGVTYIGYDTVTATTVNVREFLPLGLCERDVDGATVLMLSGSEYSFNDALTKFVELSRELFKLNELPALFDVLDVREANNTAYRITRAVPGISLREFLMRNGGLLKWDQARSLFAPLVASISALHKSGVIHRGISPDTLIVGKDGKLRLSGFCIAECRTAKSALTSQLFPGFAAVEQYGAAGTQGAWTDIYAFAATIYRTLVGNPPPEATDRLEDDNMTIPAKIAREIPKAVLETLANALQVLPQDRTQKIDSMRQSLSISSVTSATTTIKAVHTKPQPEPDAVERPERRRTQKQSKNTGKMYGLVAGIVTAFLLAVVVLFIASLMGVFNKDDPSTNSTPSNNFSSMTFSTEAPTSKLEITETGKLELVSFVGRKFTDVCTDANYIDDIKFKVSSKQYSEEYAKGQIISQSPKAGEVVEVGTTIEVVISLGPSTTTMISVVGLEKEAALLELLKAGYSYENIEFEEKYDDTATPGVVIATNPEQETRINVDTKITVILNSYKGTTTTSQNNNSTNANN